MPLTTGQKIILGLGGLSAIGVGAYTAWQAGLLAGIGLPPPPPPELKLPVTKAECEAAGFDWYENKCVAPMRPLPGTNFHKKGPKDEITWNFDRPYFVAFVLYRFKAGGTWFHWVTLNVDYKGLDDKWHYIGPSQQAWVGSTSLEQAHTVNAKAVGIRWRVGWSPADDIDEIWASIQ